jgi:hypothetical protein
VAGSATYRHSVDRICRSVTDSRALRLELLDVLRSAVGFDAYAWLLTDPETAVGAGPLADVPCLDELPRLIRLRYLTDLNRWTGLGETVAASLHHATGGELARSLVWRDLLSSYDVGDVASVVFADRYGCWGASLSHRRRIAILSPRARTTSARSCSPARPALTTTPRGRGSTCRTGCG